ncbi:MAG TPA: (2Fe-2S) ferredoxin domain-containing protein [Anaerolineales bacterium]|nr:(2Fe-2S) ferredoxin domain-containing protein [Anaerolineales bacterium]
MQKITSLDELHRLKVELVMKINQEAYHGTVYVTVGMGTCGIAAGALETYHALEEEIEKQGLKHVTLSKTGCIGLCGYEPIVEVTVGDAPKVSYRKVSPETARRIVLEHVRDGQLVEEFLFDASPFPSL